MKPKNARNGHSLNYYIDDTITDFGRIMWYLGVFEIYPNCDTSGYKLNWWNPIAVIFMVLVVLIAFLIWGITDRKERVGMTEAWNDHKFYFDMPIFFRENPHLIEFIPRSKKKRDHDEFLNKLAN